MGDSKAQAKEREQLRGIKQTTKYLNEHSMEYVLALIAIAEEVDTQPSVKAKIYKDLLDKSIANKQYIETDNKNSTTTAIKFLWGDKENGEESGEDSENSEE